MGARKVHIDVDRQTMYTGIKQEQIAEFVKNEENPDISPEFKKSARELLIQDIAGINRILGLDETDGVREWLGNKEE